MRQVQKNCIRCPGIQECQDLTKKNARKRLFDLDQLRQEDWQKRLRELRYPVVGMEIETGRYKTEHGFVRSTYKLVKWVDLPPDHQKLIRAWDNKKKRPELKRQLGIA